MNNYKGLIVEESLENKLVLNKLKILNTVIEPTTEEDNAPWISKWTMHTVEVSENNITEIVKLI